MKADKSGTFTEQQRYKVRWKSGSENKGQWKRCSRCYFFQEDITACNGFNAKTQKISVCDSFIERRGS